LGATTLSIKAFSITTLSITTLSIMEVLLCLVSFMLSVTNELSVLSVVMLSVAAPVFAPVLNSREINFIIFFPESMTASFPPMGCPWRASTTRPPFKFSATPARWKSDQTFFVVASDGPAQNELECLPPESL
jgi:hypothetical protein